MLIWKPHIRLSWSWQNTFESISHGIMQHYCPVGKGFTSIA
jgi:hypothetical protein